MDQWPGEEKELACLRLILSYVTDTVKASFKREITELAVIPGGLTSLLQPLDVSLNKPFEDEVRKQWMADGIHEFTATERQKKASEEPICSWISQAWKAIPSEMIATSFLKCGITNNSNGSKYNLVYNRDHWWTWWFSHRKPIWIELRVGIWRFRCLKTLNILLKSYAMQWWYSS